MKQIGFVMFPSGKRLRLQASVGGVHGTLEEPSMVQLTDGPATWREVKREPPIRTADELLVVMINMRQAPGMVSALLDAWASVLEQRATPHPVLAAAQALDAAGQDVEHIAQLQVRKTEPN